MKARVTSILPNRTSMVYWLPLFSDAHLPGYPLVPHSCRSRFNRLTRTLDQVAKSGGSSMFAEDFSVNEVLGRNRRELDCRNKC